MVHIAMVVSLLSVQLPEVLYQHSMLLVKHIPKRKMFYILF